MAYKYLVAKGRSMLYKTTNLGPGTDVTNLGLKHMEDHIRSGHVVRIGEAEASATNPPEPPATFKEPLKSDQDADPKGKSVKLETVGKWTFNPAKLEEKTLDQLNVLVQERDSSQSPFEKREDAVARLSSDFKPGPAPVKK